MSTDLYRKCSKCGITPQQDNLLPFHRFPKPGKTNILRAKAWAKYCWPEQESWSLESLNKLFTSNKVLCKRHFEDSCFTDSAKTRLSKFSVPGETQYVIQLMASLRREMNHNSDKTEKNTLVQAERTVEAQHVFLHHDNPTTSQQQVDVATSMLAPPSEQVSSILKQPNLVQQVDFAVATPQAPAPSEQVPSTSKQQDNKVKPKEIETGILKSVNVRKVSDLNEREKTLYGKCRRYTKELSRLRKKLKSKKKADVIKTLVEDHSLKKLLDLNISSSFAVLLQSQWVDMGSR